MSIKINENETSCPDARKNTYEGEIVPIYKPAGISSFGVVRQIRRATGVKKVGHAGTLDPFAEGLLLVGIGRSATRRLGQFLHGDKEYIATVVLGIVTDTYDHYGKIVEKKPYEIPENDVIIRKLKEFEGESRQVPPPFSAVKVGGMRMYKAARSGIKLEAAPRSITISRIELIRITPDGFEMRINCSHGTYIRSLAYDLGRNLGTGAHLGKLVRSRVGTYTVDQAYRLDEFLNILNRN